MAFQHHFVNSFPLNEVEKELERHKGQPLLSVLEDMAGRELGAHEEVQALPERNQQMLVNMANFMINSANRMVDSHDAWRENYWGLYIIGSRARGEARSGSDLDLLSVGTFYGDLQFAAASAHLEQTDQVWDGYSGQLSEDIPDEYNIGEVDRKYIFRATPYVTGALAVDLSIVDLTFVDMDLDEFKTDRDVDDAGAPLPRIPLVELTVAPVTHSIRI